MTDHNTVKLGRLAPHPATLSKRVSLAAVFGSNLPTPSASRDWNEGETSRPVFANDRVGDCTCATIANALKTVMKVVYGSDVPVSDSDVLSLYEKFGYDPSKTDIAGNNPTDQGAVFENVVQYLLKNGFLNHHFLGAVSVSPKNPEDVKRVIDWFGISGIGIGLPKAWQGRKIWSLDGYNRLDPNWSPWSWGGHETEASKYDENGIYVWTWGELVLIPWDAVAAYVDEVDGLLMASWIKKGVSPVNVPLDVLQTRMSQLRNA